MPGPCLSASPLSSEYPVLAGRPGSGAVCRLIFCPAHLQWKDYWIAVGFFQPPLLLQPLFVQPRAAESPLLVLTGMVFPSFLENISIFFMFSPLFRLKYILESADPAIAGYTDYNLKNHRTSRSRESESPLIRSGRSRISRMMRG